MTSEERFRWLVRGLLRIGIPPTPTTINRFMDRMHRHKSNHLNGREAAWRRDELLAAGWHKTFSTFGRDTWRPPT